MARVRKRRGKRVVWTLRGRHFVLSILLLTVLVGGALWLIWPFWELSGQFGRAPVKQPSRLWAAPLVVETSAPIPVREIVTALDDAGYVATDELPRIGQYRKHGQGLDIHHRSFPTPRGWTGAHRLSIDHDGRRITRIEVEDREVTRASIEPPVVASFYGADRKERRPVRMDQVPEDLVLAVLAAEDARFFEHPGVSIVGIARAAVANLKGGNISQGGSTLTQQLVKNIFLTHERSLQRKLREVVLAVMVDLRYSKREILQAYFNEIYLGARGSVSLMGVGAASWAYFGRPPSALNLSEAATLAGIIPAPANYAPTTSLETAQSRRDLVLGRLESLGWIEPERIRAARASALEIAPQTAAVRRAPYFTDRAMREARARFDLPELADRGFVLLSTLSWPAQRAAESAVDWGLESLEADGHRLDDARLEASLVSIDVATGGVRAYVGGRDYGSSQFDRAGQARRQLGSAFKPVVYAAAFRRRTFTPATLVEDAPLTLTVNGKMWTPGNSDGTYRGWVPVRRAIEQSLNLPTVRVAMDTGLDEVVTLGQRMGLESRLLAVPAMALGAGEVTAVEVATVYATLASGGIRPGVSTIRAVLAPTGDPMTGSPPPSVERVLEPEVAFLVSDVLRGVIDHGTGRGARRMGLRDPVAGKTGTTNDRRDNWFAGYSPRFATAVWVGYDGNQATKLSGGRAALPIWTRFTYANRPPGGYLSFEAPSGIARAVIDPESGELARLNCPSVATEVFLAGATPAGLCQLHRGRAYPQPEGIEPEDGTSDRGRFRRWLDRVLGRDDG